MVYSFCFIIFLLENKETPERNLPADTVAPESPFMKTPYPTTRLSKKTTYKPTPPPLVSESLQARVVQASSKHKFLKGNPTGKVFAFEPACTLCKRKKHTCAWELRSAANSSVPTGSQCYFCVKACQLNKVTRCVDVLKQVPEVMDAILDWNRFLVARKRSFGGDGDACNCSGCKRQRSAI